MDGGGGRAHVDDGAGGGEVLLGEGLVLALERLRDDDRVVLDEVELVEQQRVAVAEVLHKELLVVRQERVDGLARPARTGGSLGECYWRLLEAPCPARGSTLFCWWWLLMMCATQQEPC